MRAPSKPKRAMLKGDGLDEFRVRPIEEYLDALATPDGLPGVAVGMCLVRIDESGPALRAALERAANGESLTTREENLFFFGLFVLGGRRDEQSFPALLRFLRRPNAEIDRLLGDAVTESLGKIVSGMYNGDLDALFGLIVDPALDEFLRSELLAAAAFLAWAGRIERDRFAAFLAHFYAERLAEEGEYVWVEWAEAIARLNLRELVPLVERARAEGLLSEDLEPEDFEEDLALAEKAPDDIARFEHSAYMEDVLVELEHLERLWTRRDPDLPESAEADDELGEDLGVDDDPDFDDFIGADELDILSSTPASNPFRDVGRNDPCPCGSGKKFKRCCGR